MAEAMLLEREARAHELLTLTATERYTRFRDTHRELLSLLRSYDIASYLGITPVSLSRLRARHRSR
jgi:CRP-like cAMP-binding protein